MCSDLKSVSVSDLPVQVILGCKHTAKWFLHQNFDHVDLYPCHQFIPDRQDYICHRPSCYGTHVDDCLFDHGQFEIQLVMGICHFSGDFCLFWGLTVAVVMVSIVVVDSWDL